jgi:hypothetical protein
VLPLEQMPSLPQQSLSALVPKAKRSESRGKRKIRIVCAHPARQKLNAEIVTPL